VEIRIPIQSITFDSSLPAWGFNIERRVERLQEVSRWASPFRDAKVTQSSRAGLLVGLPHFSSGIGLTVRPAATGGVEKTERGGSWGSTGEPSLDAFQRLGSNVTLMGTLNTDFAETEVDTRRTNLTRFPLFFPEKRTFFLEGSDIFDFGLGLGGGFHTALIPFFSRRIGLLEGSQVSLDEGGKLSGRMGRTNFGGLVTHMGRADGVAEPTTLGAFRVRQNIMAESTVGVIGTFGDPLGRPGSYLTGADFTYQTSHLRGNKNFLVGAWGLVTGRDGLTGDRTAAGVSVDYPNDTWDLNATYYRIGDGFDPSLGFVPRRSIQSTSLGIEYTYRPKNRSIWRAQFYELRPGLITNLHGRWESYRVFTAPLNWRFESGERLEFNIMPQGERLDEPFEISDGVVIQPGAYHWVRYRLEGGIASKRTLSGRVTWWFGPFYDGNVSQLSSTLTFKPSELFNLEFSLTRNDGSLPEGDFVQQILALRTQVNFSPDLQLSSFIQYDTEARELGTNTRLRWTFDPLGDVFVVYNYNASELMDRWGNDSSQLLVKVQYAIRR